jgi:hypothetical protein
LDPISLRRLYSQQSYFKEVSEWITWTRRHATCNFFFFKLL